MTAPAPLAARCKSHAQQQGVSQCISTSTTHSIHHNSTFLLGVALLGMRRRKATNTGKYEVDCFHHRCRHVTIVGVGLLMMAVCPITTILGFTLGPSVATVRMASQVVDTTPSATGVSPAPSAVVGGGSEFNSKPSAISAKNLLGMPFSRYTTDSKIDNRGADRYYHRWTV